MGAKAMTTSEVLKSSQSNYKGNDIHDLVEVEIVKANKHYKVGDKDIVHPATAEIFKAKGLIKDFKKVDREALNKEAEKGLKEYTDSLLT